MAMEGEVEIGRGWMRGEGGLGGAQTLRSAREKRHEWDVGWGALLGRGTMRVNELGKKTRGYREYLGCAVRGVPCSLRQLWAGVCCSRR